MREIKFRFWDTDEKKYKLQDGFRSDMDINDMFVTCWRAGIIAEQYTGLKDKNGKEIYENDVIIFDNSDIGGERHVGAVEWNSDMTLGNQGWGLWILPNKGWLNCDFLGYLEIVGNIHVCPPVPTKTKHIYWVLEGTQIEEWTALKNGYIWYDECGLLGLDKIYDSPIEAHNDLAEYARNVLK